MSREPLELLGSLLRAQRAAAGLSLRRLSELTNVSNAYLSQLERGQHEPSLSVLRAITDALEVPLAPLLARAGLLDPPAHGEPPWTPSAEAAIMQDPALTEPQRLALLSVYRSFMAAGR